MVRGACLLSSLHKSEITCCMGGVRHKASLLILHAQGVDLGMKATFPKVRSIVFSFTRMSSNLLISVEKVQRLVSFSRA